MSRGGAVYRRGYATAGRPRAGARGGLTLVETLIALFILGFCAGGMVYLVVALKEVSDQARDHYTAVNLAKNRIEQAKALDWTQLPLMVEDGTVVDGQGDPDSDGRFRRSTVVDTTRTNLTEFVVLVAVRDRRTLAFGDESEMVRTYMAEMRGPPDIQ